MRDDEGSYSVMDWDNDIVLSVRHIGLVIYSYASDCSWKPSDIWAD